MKVYISGKISGLELETAIANFSGAESLLVEIGLIPVNPLKINKPLNKTWKEYILNDIKHLFDCDAILMLSNWEDSRGARIEKHIAEEMGMPIYYQTAVSAQSHGISTIKQAILNATGLRFEEYTIESRNRTGYFARLIFAHQCLNYNFLTIKEIASAIHRDETNVQKYGGKYASELKYNKTFSGIAHKVDCFLNKCVLQ